MCKILLIVSNVLLRYLFNCIGLIDFHAREGSSEKANLPYSSSLDSTDMVVSAALVLLRSLLFLTIVLHGSLTIKSQIFVSTIPSLFFMSEIIQTFIDLDHLLP